ncbi:hypothetical protein [Aeromonas molluscorum]|uniref:hypothetical protein n=1 Tax=Aeromonas molluscorum TaxID=271417 RepID=UPI003F1A9E02
MWLSDRVESVPAGASRPAEPLELLQRKEHRERLAMNYVERVQRLLDAAANGRQHRSRDLPLARLWPTAQTLGLPAHPAPL